MGLVIEWPGLAVLTERLDLLSNFDPTPVLERWKDVVAEGNRRGVLAGLDGNDAPMAPLKYRDGKGKKTGNRRVPNFGTTAFLPGDSGGFTTLPNDNLSTAQYRTLKGPRLAPRGEASRAIKNLEVEIRNTAPGTWEVVGGWGSVVGPDGRAFLPYHFEGSGRNPRYDLRPIRPRDWQFCLNALDAASRLAFFGSI